MLDTNILGRLTDQTASQYAEIDSVIQWLRQHDFRLGFTPPIKREFLGFAERPKGDGALNNGLGLSKIETIILIEQYKFIFTYIEDKPEIDQLFDKLHKQFGGGRTVNIVASMLAHDINTILTYNEKDFKVVRSANYINILSPATVLQDQIDLQS